MQQTSGKFYLSDRVREHYWAEGKETHTHLGKSKVGALEAKQMSETKSDRMKVALTHTYIAARNAVLMHL